MEPCDSFRHEGGVCGGESAVVGVGLNGVGPAGAESETGGGFPVPGEPSRCVECVDRQGVAPVREYTAAFDGGELLWVTDGDESPLVLTHEFDESCEVGGRDHPGLIEDHGRAGGIERDCW